MDVTKIQIYMSLNCVNSSGGWWGFFNIEHEDTDKYIQNN